MRWREGMARGTSEDVWRVDNGAKDQIPDYHSQVLVSGSWLHCYKVVVAAINGIAEVPIFY